jgi:hypothetical protein
MNVEANTNSSLVVEAIRGGNLKEAFDLLYRFGWIVEGNGHNALVAEYAKAIEETKSDGTAKTVLVIALTQKETAKLKNSLHAAISENGPVVTTSSASQSKRADISLTSLNRASLQSISAEQVLVISSRGRERSMIFTDLSRGELMHAIELSQAETRGVSRYSA